MKNGIMWSALFVAGALSGCAHQAPTGMASASCTEPAPPTMPTTEKRPCNFAHCWVDVAVEQEPYPSCRRFVTVEVDKLVMAKGNSARIHWFLVTTGSQYEFRLGPAGKEYTDGSVFFKPASVASAPSQFSPPKLDGPKHLTMDNQNRDSKEYRYGVRVYDTTGKDHPRPVDPAVFNDF